MTDVGALLSPSRRDPVRYPVRSGELWREPRPKTWGIHDAVEYEVERSQDVTIVRIVTKAPAARIPKEARDRVALVIREANLRRRYAVRFLLLFNTFAYIAIGWGVLTGVALTKDGFWLDPGAAVFGCVCISWVCYTLALAGLSRRGKR